jgi:hypothetical protein
MKSYQKLIACFACGLISTLASAQKLPAVQHVSLRASGPVESEGQPGENFQAYDKGNHIYYTIANDDTNLYLSAYTPDKLTIQKIVRWGLRLTVSTSVKNAKNAPSISFPVPDVDKNYSIIRTAGSEVASKATYNAKMAAICKLIDIQGLTGLAGPSISVYNSDGVKAKGLFNDQLEYTYELTVPLKYLNLTVNDKSSFWYDIKLNGGSSNIKPGTPPPPVVMRDDGRSDPSNDYLFSSTNFGGECTLAVK